MKGREFDCRREEEKFSNILVGQGMRENRHWNRRWCEKVEVFASRSCVVKGELAHNFLWFSSALQLKCMINNLTKKNIIFGTHDNLKPTDLTKMKKCSLTRGKSEKCYVI